MGLEHPMKEKKDATIPGQSAAATADQIVAVAPFDGTVTGVKIASEAAVTGATATKRTFTLTNKGQAGAGTAAVAVLDLVTGQDLVAFDEKDFTLGSAALVGVVAGDVLALVETVTSTGTAHSGGLVSIEFTKA